MMMMIEFYVCYVSFVFGYGTIYFYADILKHVWFY